MQTLEHNKPHHAAAASQGAAHGFPRASRIAFLLSQYPAVSHTFFLNEVLGLRARGFDVETVSVNLPDRPFPRLSPLEAAEAEATRYIKSGSWFSMVLAVLSTCITHPAPAFRGLGAVLRLSRLTLRGRLQWLFYLAEALLVGRWMKDRRLRHLHVHFGGPVASVGMLTSIAWQIPYSLTIHGPDELLNSDTFHLREKLLSATSVLCISDFCRSQLCQLLPPSAWAKLAVIRLGVDPAVLTPAHLPSQTPAGFFRIVCTGRLVPAKGHYILLEAVLLLRKRGIELDVTLIGKGPELVSLQSFVREHRLETSIHFASSLSHAHTLELVRAADLFVLASFAEGIPVALMEAMALGIPCISTSVAGIPELIESGRDGLLVPPANATALADAIESLVIDPALRRFLAGSARQRIIRDYNLPLNHELLAQHFGRQLSQPTEHAR